MSHGKAMRGWHRRLCVGVRAKLKVWCRACRSQALDHRLRSTLCVFGAKREGVTTFPKKGATRIWLGTWSSEMACRGKRGNASEKIEDISTSVVPVLCWYQRVLQQGLNELSASRPTSLACWEDLSSDSKDLKHEHSWVTSCHPHHPSCSGPERGRHQVIPRDANWSRIVMSACRKSSLSLRIGGAAASVLTVPCLAQKGSAAVFRVLLNQTQSKLRHKSSDFNAFQHIECGLCERCLAQHSYVITIDFPLSVFVASFRNCGGRVT